MKKILLLSGMLLLGFVIGVVAAQPSRREADDRRAQQVRHLTIVALAFQRNDPAASMRLLTAFSEIELAKVGEAAKKDIAVSLAAYSRASGTPLDPIARDLASLADEAAVRQRIADFVRIQKTLNEPNQAPEPTATAVTPPAAQEPRQP